MAKAKQDSKPDGKHDTKSKKVASISRIFKNAKKHASPKAKGRTANRQPLQEIKPQTKHKRKLTPEHFLAAAFNSQHALWPSSRHPLTSSADSTETSREIIEKDSAQLVQSTTNHLSESLRKRHDSLSKQLEADYEADVNLVKPLGNEEIQYTKKDGSQVGSAPLSARVKKFKKTVAEEEEKLKSLFEQLAQVDEEIAKDAEAALGPDWAKIIGCEPFGKAGGVVTGEEKETEDDMQEMRSHFEELIDGASEKHFEEMKASEKVTSLRFVSDRADNIFRKAFKARHAKDRQRIIAMMKDDD